MTSVRDLIGDVVMTDDFKQAIRSRLRRPGGERNCLGTVIGTCPLCGRFMGQGTDRQGNGGVWVAFEGRRHHVVVCEPCDDAVCAGGDQS